MRAETWTGSDSGVLWLVDTDAGTWTNVTSWMRCSLRHRWWVDSLRGTNKHQRVEHLRCLDCGHKITRVWLDLPKQGRPDREYER